jgi:hypothetical protein
MREVPLFASRSGPFRPEKRRFSPEILAFVKENDSTTVLSDLKNHLSV